MYKIMLVLTLLFISASSKADTARELYQECMELKLWNDSGQKEIPSDNAKKCLYFFKGFDAGYVSTALYIWAQDRKASDKENPYAMHCGVKYKATVYDHILAFLSWMESNPKEMSTMTHLAVSQALIDKFPCLPGTPNYVD